LWVKVITSSPTLSVLLRHGSCVAWKLILDPIFQEMQRILHERVYYTQRLLHLGWRMLGFQILVSGTFRREQLHIIYNNKEKNYTSEAIDFIEKVWIRKLASRTKLFDSKLFRVVSYNIRDENLFIELENTSYKWFVGSRDEEFLTKFGFEMTANPLSVGAVVVTSDNQFIVGKRRGLHLLYGFSIFPHICLQAFEVVLYQLPFHKKCKGLL